LEKASSQFKIANDALNNAVAESGKARTDEEKKTADEKVQAAKEQVIKAAKAEDEAMARAKAAANDSRRTDKPVAQAEVKKEEKTIAPVEPKKEETTQTPAGAIQSLIKDGIVPTTIAFQDLIKKGIMPMLTGTQVKALENAKKVEDAKKAAASQREGGKKASAGGGGGGGAAAGAGKSSAGGGSGGGGSAGGAAPSSGGGGGGGGGSASGNLSGPKLPAVGDKQPTGASPDSMQADVGDLSKYLKLQPGVNLQGLEPGVQKRLAGMASEYFNTTGQKIQVNTAYRDSKEQAELFKKYGSPRAAPPGRSKHEVGLAFDINSADANKAVGLGLFEKFGFARPISAEAWHIEAKEARGGSPDNPAAPGKSVKVAGAGGKETSPDTGKPSAKNGGIVKGPMSGFDAELHGAEAVVPLPDGKKIPVTFSNLGKNVLDQLSQQSGFDPSSYLNDIQTAVTGGGKSSMQMPDYKSVMDNVAGSVSGLETNAKQKTDLQMSTPESTSTTEASNTGKQSLGQEDSVSLLSSLNNKMDQLISINGQLANINSDQLRVQKGFSFGDMFKSPV
jgi:hypothetical protein